MENTNQQNLDLIANTIKIAQRRFFDDSPYFILWGCAVFFASLIQYFLTLFSYSNNGIGWIIIIPIAIICQIIIVKTQRKNEKTKTYIENIMVSMWIAFGISLFIILFFSYKIENNTYPIILCLYAFTTFVSGKAFKINAFIFGSFVCWINSIISFFVEFNTQLILLASGVLFAFIIPGIILRINEKGEKK
jgi:hypothetical protein